MVWGTTKDFVFLTIFFNGSLYLNGYHFKDHYSKLNIFVFLSIIAKRYVKHFKAYQGT